MRRLTVISAIAIALSSCKSDKDKDGLADDKDHCPTEYAKTVNGCLPEQKINAVRFFIDRSGSMNGYYKGETGFVNTIVDFLAKVESIRPVKEVWLVGDGAEKFDGDASAFRDSLPRTQPKGEKSSMMDDIFETIAAKTDSNDISVFTSDGILSYSDQDIKKNGNINKEKAQALGVSIFTTFNNLRKSKNFGASIYAFKSAFNGTYYNYRNGKIKLKGEERPYYIWIVGRKNLLRKFNAELSGFSTFRPLEQLHFGLDDGPVTKMKFMPSIERAGEWSLNDAGNGIADLGKSSSKFSIAVDLSSLPAYAQQTVYLKEHLQLDLRSCEATVQIKDKRDVDVTKLHSDRQKEDFESATHIFIVNVKRLNTRTAVLNIALPVKPDTWYELWSCDDDLNLKQSCTGQTFSFVHLVDGALQAYQHDNKHYIDLSIPLEQ